MSMNIQQYRIATDEEVKWFLNATYDDDCFSEKWFDDFTTFLGRKPTVLTVG